MVVFFCLLHFIIQNAKIQQIRHTGRRVAEKLAIVDCLLREIGGDRRKIGGIGGWVGRNAEGWDKWDFNNF